MERKERKKPGTKESKKKTAQPKTTQHATVKKAVAKKKTAAKKTVQKKAKPRMAVKKAKRAIPTREMTSWEWVEAFSFGLFVGQLQDFFKWCWENIDKEKTRDLVVGLYRTLFFPFESMPVHEPLPIWRRRQVLGFLKSLTGPNAAALAKTAKQWAQETDRDLDLLGGGR